MKEQKYSKYIDHIVFYFLDQFKFVIRIWKNKLNYIRNSKQQILKIHCFVKVAKSSSGKLTSLQTPHRPSRVHKVDESLHGHLYNVFKFKFLTVYASTYIF